MRNKLLGCITWHSQQETMSPVFIHNYPTSVWDCLSLQKESHVWSRGLLQSQFCVCGGGGESQSYNTHNRHWVWKNPKFCESPNTSDPNSFGKGFSRTPLRKNTIYTRRSVPALQGPRQHLTSVWRMAALCSLAVSDSLSTSMCCLQSEFWLLRVSSFVCKARSSDSFLESSCFSWSIWKTKQWQNQFTLLICPFQ